LPRPIVLDYKTNVVLRSAGGDPAKVTLTGHLDGYFVDPASGNLALTSSATGALSRGVPLAGVSDDIRARARAENPDLGAWESEKPAQASPASR
jgi:hypothetical protein